MLLKEHLHGGKLRTGRRAGLDGRLWSEEDWQLRNQDRLVDDVRRYGRSGERRDWVLT